MIFDGKPTRDIAVDEIRQVVAEQVAEDRHLDYKRCPYPSTDSGTRELLKDVTAFANADGGYLIIGVEEDGAGRAAGFINVENADNERRSIIDRCIPRIEPRLRELDIRGIDVDGNTVLVVHIHESDRKPHCAKPDAEHHYFWRRYEDGNKIMSTAEIRECFEGDRIHRELADLSRGISELSEARAVVRELDMEIDEGNLLQVQTPQAFCHHAEQQFLSAIGETPYYRLCATPIPADSLNLRDRRMELIRVLRNPPKFRQSGWDVTSVGEFQQTPLGLIGTRIDFRHLRLLWNGHLEFWTRADDSAFGWDDALTRQPTHAFLFPYAIIESAACFVRLVHEVCRVAEYDGELQFALGLHNIQGRYLAPGAPGTFGYARARNEAGRPGGPQPFASQHLRGGPVAVQVGNLPNAVAWRLVLAVYYSFGYANDQIPLFDEVHRCAMVSDQNPE